MGGSAAWIGNLDLVIGGEAPAAADLVRPVGRGSVRARSLTGDGPLGVVTTTAAEERLWLRHGARGSAMVIASLGDAGRAREAARELVSAGCGGLVSFGLASALAPAMRPGDIVVAEAVALPGRTTIRCDAGWRTSLVARLRATGLRVVEARIAGADEVPVLPGDRHRAFQATFSAAMDTESHEVARAASDAGLPFLVVRAVVDSVHRPLAGVDGAERSGVLLLARNLLLRPWYLPTAWRFAKDCKSALASLQAVPELLPVPVKAAAA